MKLGWKRRPSDRLIVCRHCAEPFLRSRIGILCGSGSCRQDLFHADLGGFWQDDSLDLSRECPRCRLIGFLESVCPHCRGPLDIEKGVDRLIAVIGATASGKTHFLAAVLHQLLEDRVGGEEWTVDLPGTHLRQLRERLLDPLFSERRIIPKNSDRVEGETRLPLENRSDGRRILLVFRDLGGEIFQQEDRIESVPFLRFAHGVVLMADPLAYATTLEAEGFAWSSNHQPTALETLRAYRKVIERPARRKELRSLPLLPGQKFLAVTVTKADLVLSPRHSFWDNSDGAHLGLGYWKKRAAEDETVKSWIEDKLDSELVEEANEFSEARFFFVSSLGFPHAPTEERLEEEPKPRRVHEPIFALLDRLTSDYYQLPSSDWSDEL